MSYRAVAAALLALLSACAAAPAPSPPKVPKLGGDVLSARLDRVSRRLASSGYQPAGRLARGFLAPRDHASVRLVVAPRTCAALVAYASPSLLDLDAALYTADGRLFAQDEGADAHPSLSACAGSSPLALYLALHAYLGGGAYVVGRFDRPLRDGDLADAEREAPELFELVRTLEQRGFEQRGPVVELGLLANGVTRVALPVRAGTCYGAVGTPSPGGQASMRLLNRQGDELARSAPSQTALALQHCAQADADLVLELLSDRASSLRLLRFELPQGLSGGGRSMWLGEPAPSRAPSSEDLDAQHTGQVVALAQGQVVSLPFDPPRARCERWELSVRDRLTRASLRVEARGGRVLGRVTSRGRPASLRVCPPESGRRGVLTGLAGTGSVRLAVEPTGQRAD